MLSLLGDGHRKKQERKKEEENTDEGQTGRKYRAGVTDVPFKHLASPRNLVENCHVRVTSEQELKSILLTQ